MSSPLRFHAQATDYELLASSGAFDPSYYAAQSGLTEGQDLLAHYLETGLRSGLQPRPDFDGSFLQPYYDAAGISTSVLLAWSELSERYGQLPTSRAQAEARSGILRSSGLFDAAWYSRRLPPGLDPALHYVIIGEAAGWRPSPAFDPDYYAERYPDILAARCSPLDHYASHGRREGRSPRAAVDRLSFPSIAASSGRDVVLVLVHEASRTGAPLLGWNIAERLAARYDIVSVILHRGTLLADFVAISSAVVGPMRWEEWNPTDMSRVADRLVRAYGPRYAVANSIETSQLVPHLAMRGVPSVALIHEFASYTKPKSKLNDVFDWATHIVFPARTVAESAFEALPHTRKRQGVHVFPQGRVTLPQTGAPAKTRNQDDDSETFLSTLKAGKGSRKPFIVLGAGTVDIRKGVDIFFGVAAACCRQAPELDIRFVWIGSGYDPETNDFANYVSEQIARSGCASRCTLLKPVTDLDPLYEVADLFLLSSRLDPQPNVAIEALVRSLPTVCFENASGTAEVLAGDPATRDLVVPYFDTSAAASVIGDLASNPVRHAALRVAIKGLAERTFDIDGYADKIDVFGSAAAKRLNAEEAVLLDAVGLDADMVLPSLLPTYGVTRLANVIQQQWAVVGLSEDQAGNTWFRRGEAGFHPQIYASHHPACTEGGHAPLAHWINMGRPDGPWKRPQLALLPSPATSPARVAIHGHFHYPDILPDFLARLNGNAVRPDLWLTTDTAAKAQQMQAACADWPGRVRVETMPNRGRDIGPFLHLLPEIVERDYDVVGHMHGKKSLSTDKNMGERWRDFLWTNLIGPDPIVDTVASAFSRDTTLGLVFAEDPHLVGWDTNRDMAESLARRMGFKNKLETFFDFPLGTMFWARPKALQRFQVLGLSWADFPAEPLGDDGTILHAIERLIPFTVQEAGWTAAGIHVPFTSW